MFLVCIGIFFVKKTKQQTKKQPWTKSKQKSLNKPNTLPPDTTVKKASAAKNQNKKLQNSAYTNPQWNKQTNSLGEGVCSEGVVQQQAVLLLGFQPHATQTHLHQVKLPVGASWWRWWFCLHLATEYYCYCWKLWLPSCCAMALREQKRAFLGLECLCLASFFLLVAVPQKHEKYLNSTLEKQD